MADEAGDQGPDLSDEKLVIKLKEVYKKHGVEPYKKIRTVFPSANITILNVDLQTQHFACEFELRLFWREPDLKEFLPKDTEWSIRDDQMSIPIDIDDPFEDDLGLEWIQQEYTFHYETSTVEMLMHLTDKFSERMELDRFPLDRQFLNILFAARVGPDEGNWLWITKPPSWVPPDNRYVCQARLGPSVADYIMFPPWADFRLLEAEDTNMDDTQPPFKFRLRVERRPLYYIGQIIIPMFLIVGCCYTSLFVPTNEVADRLSVTVTLMLAAVAFRFILGGMLPPVSYLTWMDYYIIIGFVINTAFILENALAGELADPLLVDYTFSGLVGAVWLGTNAFMMYACLTDTFKIDWLLMDEEDRAPSEEDDFRPGEPGKVLGDDDKAQFLDGSYGDGEGYIPEKHDAPKAKSPSVRQQQKEYMERMATQTKQDLVPDDSEPEPETS